MVKYFHCVSVKDELKGDLLYKYVHENGSFFVRACWAVYVCGEMKAGCFCPLFFASLPQSGFNLTDRGVMSLFPFQNMAG